MMVLLAELGMWAVVAALCIEGHWWIAGGVFLFYWRYLDAGFWDAKEHDPRSVALAEGSHGAAMIALAVLALLRMGNMLPAWFPLAALAVIVWGIVKLFRGAKFSVGWRDPHLIALALIEAGIGAAVYWLVWQATIAWVPRELLMDIAVALYTTAPYGEWALSSVAVWCVVSGLTKLVLVLRGFPALPLPPPGMPHGGAGFSNPGDKGFKL
jgi:hypothetical protein